MKGTAEVWKDIYGYEGRYKVSNLGRVKSLGNDKARKEKILKPRKNKYGYISVDLSKDGKEKTYKVHRLVATAFVQRQSLFDVEVNHKDEDKTNNCVSNLEWCTVAYNNTYGTRIQRMSKPVIGVSVKDDSIITFPSLMEAVRQGFDNRGISKCCRGELKTHKGYVWQYA